MRRFEEPSAGCLMPAILGGGIAVGGIVVAIGISEGNLRLFAPLYGVTSYWMLSLCNRRTVVVEATGVRVTYGPVPNILGQFIPRSEIAFCYASDTVRDHDEGTVPDGTWFAIGFETRDGRRFHCYSRDADPQTALAAAEEIGQILQVETRLAPASYPSPATKRELLFWAVLALVAIGLGYLWEQR